MDRKKIFEEEINYIKDASVKESLITMIERIPEYFFHIAASSTGKYHPEYATGEGGLLRHTKSAVRMAVELFPIYNFSEHTKDLIIFSLVLHDSVKKGYPEEQQYSLFDHPLLAAKFVDENKKDLKLTSDDLELVKGMISSHMGKFNTSSYSDVILPVPETREQKFVHLCDFLASRKVINVLFDKNNNIIGE
jgi:23S rRNA maturation-related 3'-5' exoribonuclease YhaM